MNASLFPGAGEDVRAHAGFLGAHAKTADAVLAAVQETISGTGAAVLTTVCTRHEHPPILSCPPYALANIPAHFIPLPTITSSPPFPTSPPTSHPTSGRPRPRGRARRDRRGVPPVERPLHPYEYDHVREAAGGGCGVGGFGGCECELWFSMLEGGRDERGLE